jgi:hypothetical protein
METAHSIPYNAIDLKFYELTIFDEFFAGLRHNISTVTGILLQASLDSPVDNGSGSAGSAAFLHRGFCTEASELSAEVMDEMVASWHSNLDLFWTPPDLERWGRLLMKGNSVVQVSAFVFAITHTAVSDLTDTIATRER